MIPKGYKHTELGVLPEDWEVVRLGDIGEFLKGSGISKDDIADEGIPCIRYGELYTTYGEKIEEVFSHTDKPQEELVISKTNDVVLPSSGETAIDLASASCILKNGVAIGGDTTIIRSNQNGVFLAYCLNTVCKKQIYSIAQGSSVIHLYANYLKTIKIPIPSLAEQEKIAEILSTWDTQIQNLESLIIEKQNLKKGLCQTLLTAKTRLKGFSGDWEVVRLGDILEYEQPTKYLVSNTKYDNSYTTPVLTAGKTFILGYTDEVEGIYTNLPIILFDDFTTASQYVDFPFKVKSSACKILKLKNTEFSLRVVFEVMQRLNFVADDHKRYWISEYQNQEIFLPNAKEQRGIAEILSEADNEITLLEQKLESLKSQKRGLMQNLLNGKVRVK